MLDCFYATLERELMLQTNVFPEGLIKEFQFCFLLPVFTHAHYSNLIETWFQFKKKKKKLKMYAAIFVEEAAVISPVL